MEEIETWNPSRKVRGYIGTNGPRFMVVGKMRKKFKYEKRKKNGKYFSLIRVINIYLLIFRVIKEKIKVEREFMNTYRTRLRHGVKNID